MRPSRTILFGVGGVLAVAALVALGVLLLSRRDESGHEDARQRSASATADAPAAKSSTSLAASAGGQLPASVVPARPLQASRDTEVGENPRGESLRGELDFEVDTPAGIPREGRLCVRPRRVGADFGVPGELSDLLRASAPALGEPSACAIRGAYAIPVPARGAYDVACAIDGVFNTAVWEQDTSQDLRVVLRIAPAVDVVVSGPAVSDIASVAAIAHPPAVEPARAATRIDESRWRIAGPILLPVSIEFALADPRLGRVRRMAYTPELKVDTGSIAFLELTIKAADTLDPVPNARVDAGLWPFGSETVRAASGADGIVKLFLTRNESRASFWDLTIQAEGFVPVRMGSNQEAAPKEVLLQRNGALGGRLLDGQGRPVAGAAVHLPLFRGISRLGRSAVDGRFTLLPAREFEFLPGVSGLSPGAQALGPSLYVRTADGARGVFEKVDWPAIAAGSWTGVVEPRESGIRVLDGRPGVPLPGARIALVPRIVGHALLEFRDGPEAIADDDGRCRFRLFGTREWTAIVRRENAPPCSYPVTLVPDADIDLVVPPSQSVGLRLFDLSRRPLAGERVEIAVDRGAAPGAAGIAGVTDGDGVVSYSLPEGFRFAIAKAGEGLEPARGVKNRFAADGLIHDVVMARRRELTLEIRPADGSAVANAAIMLVGNEASGSRTFIQWSPSSKVLLLTDEWASCVVYVPGYRPCARALPDGGTLLVEPMRGPRLRGRLTGAGEGEGLPMVRLVLRSLEPRSAETVRPSSFSTESFDGAAAPSEGGAFESAPLTPGLYDLQLRNAEGKVLRTRPVVIDADLDLGEIDVRR